MQFSKSEETRTYIDCKTPNEMLETFCRIYENFLLNKMGMLNKDEDEANEEGSNEGKNNSNDSNEEKKVEYQLEDLLKFVD